MRGGRCNLTPSFLSTSLTFGLLLQMQSIARRGLKSSITPSKFDTHQCISGWWFCCMSHTTGERERERENYLYLFCTFGYTYTSLPFLFSRSADLRKRTTGNLKKKRRRNRLFDPHLNLPERDKAEFSIGPLPFSPGGKEEKKNKRYLYDSSCWK